MAINEGHTTLGSASYTYGYYPNGMTANSGSISCALTVNSKLRSDNQTSPWVTLPSGHRWRYPTPWRHGYVTINLAEKGGGTYAVYNGDNGTSIGQILKSGGCFAKTEWPGFFFSPKSSVLVGDCKLYSIRSTLQSRATLKALSEVPLADAGWGETVIMWRQTASLVTKNLSTIVSTAAKFRRTVSKDTWRRLMRQRLRPKNYRVKTRGKKPPKRYREGKGDCGKLCKASEKWLEIVYGLIPLVSDIYESLKLLDDTFKASGMAFHCHGGAQESVKPTLTGPNLYTPVTPGFTLKDCEVKGVTVLHKCHVDLWYLLSDINVARLNALGLRNPALTAWDVLRGSFIFDWFIPIGPWLESFTTGSGMTFVSGTQSYKHEVVAQTAELKGNLKPNNGLWGPYISLRADPVNVKFNLKGSNFQRTVFTEPPVPGFYVKNPLSPTHVANAFALLVGFLRTF